MKGIKWYEKYKATHGDPKLSQVFEFPNLRILSREMKHTNPNFSRNKAVALDKIEDSLFKIHKKCNRQGMRPSQQKIDLVLKIWSKEY